MATNVEDLTVNYEEDGNLLVKEIDKVVLSKGAWATVLFRYQDWVADSDTYSPDRYVIRRYKKIAGSYKMQSKFTISSKDQAKKIVESLQNWLVE